MFNSKRTSLLAIPFVLVTALAFMVVPSSSGLLVCNNAVCSGFFPPMDVSPVTVKGKNRALPLKAELTCDGVPLTDVDISSPVVQILFYPAGGGAPVDVTDDALPAGQGTEGNQFEFNGGLWRYNLKTKNLSAPGTYTIMMESGNLLEYDIADPTCMVDFIRP